MSWLLRKENVYLQNFTVLIFLKCRLFEDVERFLLSFLSNIFGMPTRRLLFRTMSIMRFCTSRNPLKNMSMIESLCVYLPFRHFRTGVTPNEPNSIKDGDKLLQTWLHISQKMVENYLLNGTKFIFILMERLWKQNKKAEKLCFL